MSARLQATSPLPLRIVPASPAPRTVRVALAGCGTVGSALVRLLAERRAGIERQHGLRVELASVLVRRPGLPRLAPLPPGVVTGELGAFLAAAADADVVVEAIGGLDPAERIAREALSRGRRLVTANKALLAVRGPELAELARRTGGALDFEAAVGGGIPIVRALRDALAETEIRSVGGVLNGTSNFILDRLTGGEAFEAALADAQRLGFAEADPARDLDGRDAEDKVRVLAWLAFGADPAALPVRRRGLLPDPDRLARDATAFGGVCRIVGSCSALPEGIAASVEPVVVDRGGTLAAVREEQNLVLVDSAWNGAVALGGPGAGGGPTASALLGDVLRGARPVPARGQPPRLLPDDRPHRWVVSIRRAAGQPGLLRRALEAGRLAVSHERIDGPESRVLLRAAPWSRVEPAVARLEATGHAPLVSRYER